MVSALAVAFVIANAQTGTVIQPVKRYTGPAAVAPKCRPYAGSSSITMGGS